MPHFKEGFLKLKLRQRLLTTVEKVKLQKKLIGINLLIVKIEK